MVKIFSGSIVCGALLAGCLGLQPYAENHFPKSVESCQGTEFMQAEKKILPAVHGDIKANSWQVGKGALQTYRIEPYSRCEFKMGSESLLDEFFESQPGGVRSAITRLGESGQTGLYQVELSGGMQGVGQVLVVEHYDGIELIMGNQEAMMQMVPCYGFDAQLVSGQRNTFEFDHFWLPNPILFGNVFKCGDRDRDREKVIYPD